MGKKNKSEITEPKPDKKAGRVKKTEEELDKDFNVYIERIANRNKIIDENNSKITNPDEKLTPLIKLLSREEWEKSKPSGESSAEIFKRLAKSRMPKTLKQFKSIAYLAKYDHSEEQKNKILTDLSDSINSVIIEFEKKSENKEDEPKEYQI